MSESVTGNKIQSISLTLQGFAVGVMLIFPALLNISLFSTHIDMYFLPIIAIHYWPKQASYSWSLFAVFLLGLTFDIFSNGPLGMWAFTYLVLFLVLDGGVKPIKGLINSTLWFLVSLLVAYVVVILLTRLSIGQWPDFLSVTLSALMTLIMFPILYWIRKLILAVRGISETDSIRP